MNGTHACPKALGSRKHLIRRTADHYYNRDSPESSRGAFEDMTDTFRSDQQRAPAPHMMIVHTVIPLTSHVQGKR